MSATRAAPRVFTIAPGGSFLGVFARGLVEGAIVSGFPAAGDPFALGKATLYVPTTRSARALAREFRRLSGRGAALVPDIVPLGRLESLDPEPMTAIDRPSDSAVFSRRGIDGFERRVALASLVQIGRAHV